MSLGLCLTVMLILDLPGISRLLKPRKACTWGVTLAGHHSSGPCLMLGSFRNPKMCPGQYISQLWVSQEEIRFFVSSPYHPVCHL